MILGTFTEINRVNCNHAFHTVDRDEISDRDVISVHCVPSKSTVVWGHLIYNLGDIFLNNGF